MPIFRRWPVIGLASLLGVGLVLLALLHAPIGRRAVLRLAADFLQDRFGVQLEADELDFNLLTLNVALSTLSVSRVDQPAAPFLTADRVHVDLPWSIVTGAVALSVVDIDRPLISLQSSDSGWNLPTLESGDDAPASDEPLVLPPIGRLTVTDLGVEVRGEDYDVEAAGIGLELVGDEREPSGAFSGQLKVAQPVQLGWKDRRTAVDRLDAQFAFDGQNLDLESFDLQMPEVELSSEGQARSVVAEPSLDLDYRTAVDLDQAAGWWRNDHGLAGRLVASGTVDGSSSAPRVSADIETTDLRWGNMSELGVRGTVHVDPDAIVVDTATVSHGDGELGASARINLADSDDTSRLNITAQDIDTLELIRQLPLDIPVTPAGIVSGNASMSWTDLQPDAVQLAVELRSRAQPPESGGMPVGGVTRIETTDGQWQAELEQITIPGVTLDGQAGGMLAPSAAPMTDTTVQGSLSIDVSDFTRVTRTFNLVELAGEGGLTGVASLTIELSGTIGQPVVTGRIEKTRLGYRGIEGIELQTTFAATGDQVTLEQLAVDLGSNRASGSLQVDLRNDTIDGDLDASFPDLSALAPALPDAAALTGRLEGRVRLGGQLAEPRVQVSLEGREMTVGGRALDQVVATARLEGGVLNVEELEVRQGSGQIRATGSYALETEAYDLEVTARALSIASLASADPTESGVGGELELDLKSSGSLSSPSGTGAIRVDALDLAGRPLGDADVGLELRAGMLLVNATLPALNATAAGEVGLVDDSSFDVTVDLARTQLSQILGASGLDPAVEVSGVTSLRVQAVGDRTVPTDARITATFGELDGLIGSTRVQLVQPGTLVYAERTVTTERVELLIDETRLTLTGMLGESPSGRLEASLVGDLADFEALVTTLAAGPPEAGPMIEMNGALDTQLVMTGSMSDLMVAAEFHLREGLLAFRDMPAAQDLNLDVSYDMQSVHLETLSGMWQGAAVDGRGEIPVALFEESLPGWLARPDPDASTGRLTLTLDDITADALRPFVDPATLGDLAGRVSVRLDLETDGLELNDVRAKLVLGELDLTVGGLPLTQQRPTEIELTESTLRVTSLAWGGLGNELTLGGTIDLAGTEPTLDLTFTGEGDLRLLGAFVEDLSTAGRAFGIINVLGTPAEPVIRGSIELSDGEVRLADPPVLVTELAGSVWLEGDEIRIHEMTGEANGGDVEIQGVFELDGLQPSGSVRVVGRQLALEVPEGLRMEVDADITLDTTDERLALTGALTILRGDYREPLALTTGLLAALQQRQQVDVIGADEPSVLDDLQLNIRVVSVEDIVIDNNYANGSIGLDLRLLGTPSSPGLTGRASIREGAEIRFGNNVYEVETGDIDFVDSSTIRPDLNITAQTRVSSYQVTLSLSGPAETLTTDLQSEPALAESDIVSLLLTGRTLDQVGSAPPGAIARDQALGLVSGEVLGTAGRSVGLDTVRIESEVSGGAFTTDSTLVAGETNPGSRLTVGKNLSDQVQLIVSQNLRESGLLTWIVEYLPRRNLELRGVLDDETDRSYEFRHSLTFGNPPRTTQQRPGRTRRPDRTISAVDFTGTPGFDESELRDRVGLKPNDRFDFRRWLRSRDRLERLYHGRGYLEAQIRARRTEDATDRIALQYDIEQGPRTQLTIDGYDLSGRAVEQMEDAWKTAVFDGFLLDRLQVLARRELIESDFVEASVETEITDRSETGVKEITVRIDPGRRASERRLAFTGNEQFSDIQLAAYLDAQDLGATAWTDPDPVVAALTTLYRGQGLLDAQIEIGVPEFQGDDAVLPISIAENTPYRIAAVDVTGVTAFDPLPVIAEAAVVDGARYTDGAVRQARANLGIRYREAGYTEARVTVQSTVNRDDQSVAVEVDVVEGLQQIVQEVSVTGAGRTRPQLISRALEIEVGEPVDLNAWNQARKRLYDTGAFRSVDIEAEPIADPPEAGDDGAQPVRARVVLQEWPLFRVRYGLQLKDEQAPLGETGRDLNLGVVGDLTHQNFLGRAATVGTAFRYDTIQQALRGFLSFRTFFGLPLTSNVFASQEREQIGDDLDPFAFINETRLLTLEQRIRRGDSTTFAYSYNLSREKNRSVVPDQFTDAPFWIARLNASGVVDTRDDVFDATSGLFHSSTVEYAPELFGSDLRFVKYSAQQYYYRSLGERVVIASAARVGLARGLGGDFLVPSERFFAGGGNTVRGYDQDSLAPSLGGNSLLVLNQEIRFPLLSIFRGVGFLDAGSAFENVKDLSLTDLKVGAGFGLRADTPFGLFRFDVARPLSDVEDRGLRFYFSIGQAF